MPDPAIIARALLLGMPLVTPQYRKWFMHRYQCSPEQLWCDMEDRLTRLEQAGQFGPPKPQDKQHGV